VSNLCHFFLAQFADDLVGCAVHQRPGRHLQTTREQRRRADDALLADHHTIHQNRAHADQYLVAYHATVQDRPVADSHIVADHARRRHVHMTYGIVLNVRMMADNDTIDIAAQHSVELNDRVRGRSPHRPPTARPQPTALR
jgi:hypothetical protein